MLKITITHNVRLGHPKGYKTCSIRHMMQVKGFNFLFKINIKLSKFNI